jgi:hypothetical protein
VLLTQAANMPPVSKTPVVPMAKFAANVIEIGGTFATGVIVRKFTKIF